MRDLVPRIFTVGLLVALLAACSTDTPTAPERTPAPPPGSGDPSTSWNITVTTSQTALAQSSTQPATIGIQARRADNGQPPPEDATIEVSANLGDFNSAASGERVVTLALNRFGSAQVLYFAPDILGVDVIEAQLERSFGQVVIDIVEPLEEVIASFLVDNPDGNLSVRFVNTSTGGPTSFFWDLGDGTTTTETSPDHVYAVPGTYFVQLTASKTGSSSTASQAVTVGEDAPEQLFITAVSPNTGTPEGSTAVTISGTGFATPLRVLFGGKLGTVTSVSATTIQVSSPPGDMNTVACTTGGGDPGTRPVDTSVSLTVELQDGTSETAPGGFTYLVSLHSDPTFGDCT